LGDADVSLSAPTAETTTEIKDEEIAGVASPSGIDLVVPAPLSSATHTDLPSAVWFDRLKRVRPFLPKRTYNWALGRVSDRYGDEWQWANGDDEANDSDAPPDGERLTWHGVWLVEAYLPSSIPALVDGLERFGWQSDRDESVGDFIAKCRLSPGGGGLMPLPMLRPPAVKGFFPGSLNRELPPGVELVTGQIHILSHSLTVLISGFKFDDSVSDEVNLALRRRYRTYHRPTKTGNTIMLPTFQRRDAMHDLEAAKINACREWLKRRAPGYFSSAGSGSSAPATILMTTKVDPLFEHHDWLHTIGLSYAFEPWETSITGLRYARRSAREGAPVLFGREPDLLAVPKLNQNGQPLGWLLRHYIEMELAGLLALMAIEQILIDASRRLGRLRDSIATDNMSSSAKQLASVKGQLGSFNSGIASLASEMQTWAKRPAWTFRELPDLQLVRDPNAEGPPDSPDSRPLRQQLLDWQVERAREVGELEASTRSLLIALSEITGALENIRLQNALKWLTLIAICIAAVALVVGVIGAAHDLGWIGATSSSPRP
jgi:hypothetical protein